jgi:hypothetical protein
MITTWGSNKNSSYLQLHSKTKNFYVDENWLKQIGLDLITQPLLWNYYVDYIKKSI